MECLVVHLAGKTRRASLHGRAHVVAPMTMLVPGVLNGSRGPLLYPPDEVASSVPAWNGIPITAGHPRNEQGQPLSARDPNVLNSQGVGVVFNAGSGGDGRLMAEAWFDEERLRHVDSRILSALNAGQPIELSTGLNTTAVPVDNAADYNGKPYTHIARNYKPDHLAVLVDEVGACSVEDGCGIMNTDEKKTLLQKLAQAIGLGSTDSVLNIKPKKEAPKMADNESKKTLVDYLIANACCWDEEDREVLANLDEDKLTAMKEFADKEARQEAVANAATKGFTDPGGSSHTWNEKTKKWDTKASEPVKNTGAVVNTDPAKAKPKPQTKDEWLSTAPPAIRSAVENAITIETREKQQLVTKLIANVADDDKEAVADKLMAKSLTDLTDIAALIPAPKDLPPIANFAGAAPAGGTQNAAKDLEVLPLPDADYSSELTDKLSKQS